MINNFAHQAKDFLKGESFRQLFLYGLVGIATNLFGYLLYLAITGLGFDHKISMTFLYLIGATISFLANRSLVFKHDGKFLGAALKFGLAHILGYFLNLSLLIFFTDKLGYAHQYVQAAAIVIVAGYLFVALRFFVFSKKADR